MAFIRGECLNGIHTVDFLIWRIRPSAFGVDLAMNCAITNAFFVNGKLFFRNGITILKRKFDEKK